MVEWELAVRGGFMDEAAVQDGAMPNANVRSVIAARAAHENLGWWGEDVLFSGGGHRSGHRYRGKR